MVREGSAHAVPGGQPSVASEKRNHTPKECRPGTPASSFKSQEKEAKHPEMGDCGRVRAPGSQTSPWHVCFSEPQFSQLQKGLVWTLLWCGTLKVELVKVRHIRAYCYCEELSRQLFLHLHHHLKNFQTTGFSFPTLSTVVHASPLRAVI